MWRKHPVSRITLGFGLAVAAALTIGGALWWGSDFWEDGQRPPLQVQGIVTDISTQSANAIPGRFKLVADDGISQIFELRNSSLKRLNTILATLGRNQPVTVIFSPRLHNIYQLEVAGRRLVQDDWEPDQPFQAWQRIAAYILFSIGALGLGGFLYMLAALADLLWPPLLASGTLVARIERAEARSDGFSILVRPWNNSRPGKQLRFELSEADFFKTDGADFVAVTATRWFHYVTAIQPLTVEDLPVADRHRRSDQPVSELLLNYRPGWRIRVYLYSDGLFALLLLVVSLAIVAGLLPVEVVSPPRAEQPQWLALPLLAILALIMAIYLLLRFKRKFQDVRDRRRVTAGPVLSKWRVTGTSNDNRRLIVVADGGLAGGEQNVRKFDLSPALYDQLQVGDLVEIEHTPRLRFICRLEVKGHQELLQPNI